MSQCKKCIYATKRNTPAVKAKVELGGYLKFRCQECQKIMDNYYKNLVLIWGRFQPPTKAHEMLIKKASRYAKEKGSDCFLFSSSTYDKTNNPLLYENKIKYLEKAFGHLCKIKCLNTNNIFEILKSLNYKYKHSLIVFVGEDRVKKYEELFNKYNRVEYNFKEIKVISVGKRDETGNEMEKVSASKLRELVIEGNFELFVENIPSSLLDEADELFDELRENLDLVDDISFLNEVDELGEALSITQRKRKGMKMRRMKGRLKVARKRALKKRAGSKVLKKRARRGAIAAVKKKITKGKKNLSVGEKNRVERMVKRRSSIVNRLARRGVQTARTRDKKRLKNDTSEVLNALNIIQENNNIKYSSFIEEILKRNV